MISSLEVFELVEATTAEVCSAFTMEAYPRVLTCPQSIVRIISERLVAEAFVRELIFCVRQYRQVDEELFSVGENVRHCA